MGISRKQHILNELKSKRKKYREEASLLTELLMLDLEKYDGKVITKRIQTALTKHFKEEENDYKRANNLDRYYINFYATPGSSHVLRLEKTGAEGNSKIEVYIYFAETNERGQKLFSNWRFEKEIKQRWQSLDDLIRKIEADIENIDQFIKEHNTLLKAITEYKEKYSSVCIGAASTPLNNLYVSDYIKN